MDWTLLIAAGLLEVVGVIGLKQTAAKETWYNYVLFIGGFVISFNLLSSAMETIPLSTAYAVWTGIGTVGAAVVGMIFYREAKNLLRMLCITGVILAVLGLKLLG